MRVATVTKRAKHILNPSSPEVGEPPQPKRQNAYERQRRIKELSEEMSDFNRIKEQRLEQATASCNFNKCDELATEISELKLQRQELNTELAGLQQKAAEYQNKKKNATLQPECSDNTSQSGEPNL